MKTKRFLAVLGVALCSMVLGSCGGDPVVPTPDPVDPDPVNPDPVDPDPVDPDPVDEACTLSISLNYNKDTGMKFNQDIDYKTPNGTSIKSGDFKPVWKAVQEELNFTINDVTDSSGKATEYFKSNWQTKQFADIAVGNVADIASYGTTGGTILDLKKYIDAGKMPNFKAFLDENPIVKVSIETASYEDASKNAIYYAPYFDGFDDIEKYTLVRADFVEKLLDADYDSVKWDTDSTIWTTNKYTAKVADTSYSVTVPESMDNEKTKTVKKEATTNIVAQQNALAQSDRTSKVMVKQFRDYLTAKYGSQYKKLSDIFLGVDACYDADEMVALMRIVKVSPYALTGNEKTQMVVYVPREYNNQRIADMYRWAGQLWGVRGVESRCGYLYVGEDGLIHDARGEADITDLLENLNALYQEGLIATNFHQKSNYGTTDGKYANKLFDGNGVESDGKILCGFMMYDYSQTQGALNEKDNSLKVEGYNFRPIINAVADWKGDHNYFQFTESWRSVKTEGWCINAAIVNDEAKLNKAIKLFDYFYSEEGQALYTCGPKSEGYYTEIVDGVPQLSEETLEQFADSNIGKKSYTDYFRKFVGAGLNNGSVKNYGVEAQCTSANALYGVNLVAHALEVGTYKHVEMAFTEDPFYTITPSTFNLTSGQATTKDTLENGGLKNINSNSSTSAYNLWDEYVVNGFGGTATDGTTLKSKSGYISYINDELQLKKLVTIYNEAYEIMKL